MSERLERLKPCPFCGHNPLLNDGMIVCGYCGVHMHIPDGDVEWSIKNWNRRAEVKDDGTAS